MLKFTSNYKYKLKQCDISFLADRQIKDKKPKTQQGKYVKQKYQS